MAEYKLCNALPRTYIGEKESHYGYMCEVRKDGVWVNLDPVTAKIWIEAGRAHGPFREDEPKKVPEVVKEPVAEGVEALKEPEVVVAAEVPVAEEVPPTMTQVMEEGSGKRGRPAKAK